VACTVRVVPSFRHLATSAAHVTLEDAAALLMLEQGDELLGAIDPYGDSAFNEHQVDRLLERMEHLAEQASDAVVQANIRQVVDFIRANMRPGLCVVLEGD